MIRGSVSLSVSPRSVFGGCSSVMGVNGEHGSGSNETGLEFVFGGVEVVEVVAGALVGIGRLVCRYG